ncbi:undecaprenyl phosphate-alpha-4-amino-4-deoxy-L-arabinose arabinosyl transferase [mine drainage metagenome]|uniref:Undecaprenyl phosphate-alpha-4-amino-4-deoxy-L-arabinose arabinosyl transferase n=1 Tax=mine drainage metagenome TaxID=410659 RepID=A0A1J5QRL7_9ZZZZ
MPFEVQHDWQASLATPRPLVGERAKTRLLLLLCFLWISLGLIGHDPWKPDEAQSISIVAHLMHGGDWAIPVMAGTATLRHPPLYYLSAAASATLLSPWMAMHNAARLSSGLWMALTLLMVGMAGREMWGKGSGRQTTFVFLGSLGLLYSAHLLIPAVAGLTGYAMAFYGLALSPRRPWRAGGLLGTGIGIAFLATGLLAAGIIALSAILLPLLFRSWRRRSTLASLSAALLFAAPWLGIWLFTLWQHAPHLLLAWLSSGAQGLDKSNLLYFLKALTWSAWPALPLAIWALWHYRRHLLHRPQFQLALTFFMVSLLLLGLGAESRDTQTLPLLLPLAILGGAAIDPLRRSMASALDWFSIMLFGSMGFLIWLGWFAMMMDFPQKLASRMHKLSPASVPDFSWAATITAITLTLIWGLVVFKAKRSNRAFVTDWAVGITMVWGLLMTLWLPWLNAAKSYHDMIADLQKSLPASYACVTSRDVGESQRALLDYYAAVRLQRFETTQHMDCDLYLIQDERGRTKIEPGPSWQLIWQGKRAADRRESFRLYQHLP